jgi:lipoprotein NlpD
LLERILLSVVLCGLLACGGNPRAPVEDRAVQPQDSTYTVKSGDTLYSIAFRYGLDYRKVAAANGIGASYTIYPGQKIHLDETVSPAQSGASRTAPVPSPVKTPAPASAEADRKVSTASTVAQSKPAVSATSRAPAPVSTPATAKVKQAVDADTYAGAEVAAWLWPTRGSVTRGYSESVHKGIDIGGERGDPVVAAAAGKVVYAGTGIVGFGELLIIKHNEVYLSAYGHNERLLVTEGQTVAAGQTIAEKGNSGTDTVKLHFEIRKEGKPIDPQRLLPQR